MHTLREYIRITLCDLQRNSVFQQIVIVAGICLPILILLGLKNGQIKDMGDKIRQNPQACSVEIYPHPRLNYEQMMDLKQYVLKGEENPHIQNVLPLSYPCDIAMRSSVDPKNEIDCVSITPTCKGDPRAKSRKAEVIDELKVSVTARNVSAFEKWFWNPLCTIFGQVQHEETAVSTADIQDDTDKTLLYMAVSKSVLKKLDLKLGDKAVVIVTRDNGAEQSFEVTLAAAYDAKDDRGKDVDEGLAAIKLVIMMKTFIYGDEVDNEHFKWAGIENPPAETYNGFLLFTNNDNANLKQDIEAINVEHDHTLEIAPLNDPEVMNLYGLLQPKAMKDIMLHYIRLPDPKNPITENGWFYRQSGSGSLRNEFDPDEYFHFSKIAYVPWNFPLEGSINGKKVKVYGVTSPKRWFNEKYKNPSACIKLKDMDHPKQYLCIDIGSAGKDVKSLTLDIEGIKLPLQVLNYVEPETDHDADDSAPAADKEGITPVGSSEPKPAKRSTDEAQPEPAVPMEDESTAPTVDESANPTAEAASRFYTQTVSDVKTETDGVASSDSEAATVAEVPETKMDETEISKVKTITEAYPEPQTPIPSIEETEIPETTTENEANAVDASSKSEAAAVPTTVPKPAPKTQDEILSEAIKDVDNVYIPAELLAHIYAYKEGKAHYSNINHLFYRSQEPQTFNSILLQVDDINNVPRIVTAMQEERGYSVIANTEQIDNMQEMDSFLNMLIGVIAVCVLVFGLITVISTMNDSTERKRGMIGILRVMGVSKFGIFFFVLLRSCIIAVFAAILMMLFGIAIAMVCILLGTAEVLPSSVLVIFTMKDILLVICGILGCCILGSLIPAWSASRIDPIQAVQEGRFK